MINNKVLKDLENVLDKCVKYWENQGNKDMANGYDAAANIVWAIREGLESDIMKYIEILETENQL